MELKKATLKDLLELQQVCKHSYSTVFADHWIEDGLTLYLEDQFGKDRLARELVEQTISYYFIQVEGINIGFVKMNYRSDEELSASDNCELEKIYILPSHSGKGIGQLVMRALIKYAQKLGKKMMFLCVLDTNKTAIAFYEKIGFEYHSSLRLQAPKFKEEIRGMYRMHLNF